VVVAIHIPIPIGIRHNVVAKGRTVRVIQCENCRQPYGIVLDLEASGSDIDLLFLDSAGSKARAAADAQEKLAAQAHNLVVAVPCPQCGLYQADMVMQMKNDAFVNPLQIIGATIALVSLIPLAFPMSGIWIITMLGEFLALWLLIRGYLLSFRYDPNTGDPASRMLLGQKSSLWGDRLSQVLSSVNKPAGTQETTGQENGHP
jgi:hypothetical protein